MENVVVYRIFFKKLEKENFFLLKQKVRRELKLRRGSRSFKQALVQGGSLDLSLKDGNVILTDAKGGMATVVIANLAASNGVIHAMDTVVMP